MHFAITDFIIDIVQNSCEAGSRLVAVELSESRGHVDVRIGDDGKGMDDREMARALDPFVTEGRKHPGRKVGLGLPFLKQAIDQSLGRFSLTSEKGRGTVVAFRFDKGQIDCPPLGDVAGSFLSMLCLPGGQEMTIVRTKPDGSVYELKKSELAEALGDLERGSSLVLLRQYLRSQEEG